MTALEQPGETFKTLNLYLASFLYCRNFPFLDIRCSGEKNTEIIFRDSAALRIAIVDYANDGVVPVRSFVNTLRDLEAIAR